MLTNAADWGRRNLPVIVSTLTLLLGWELLCRGFGIRPFLLPSPSAIWTAVVPVWPNIAMQTVHTLRTVPARARGFHCDQPAAITPC